MSFLLELGTFDAGVRCMTEHRTTDCADGLGRVSNAGGPGVETLIGFGFGMISFSFSIIDRLLFGSFFGIFCRMELLNVGYSLRCACVNTCPLLPYGTSPPSIDDVKRRTGGLVLFVDDLLVHGAFSGLFAVDMHSFENMSRTEIAEKKKENLSIRLLVYVNKKMRETKCYTSK